MPNITYIYKTLKKGLCPVARVSWSPSGVQVDASEKEILRVLQGVLSRSATVSIWEGHDLIKNKAATPQDEVTARLKRFLPRPYFASYNVPEDFAPKYSNRIEVEYDS